MEFKPDGRWTLTELLLYEILQELKKSNTTTVIDKPVKIENVCELCGKDHSNKGYALACARKNKGKKVP